MDMTTLIAAASTAAGVAPHDPSRYPGWKGRVLAISSDLAAMVGGYEAREARKTGAGIEGNVTMFHARLISVNSITKGQGANTVQKGLLTLEAFNSSNSDHQGHETIETAPLGSPEGDEEFMRAQALVGQSVKIYKRNFLHPTDKSKKLKELVAIDPSSGFSAAPLTASTPPAPPAEPAPPVASDLVRLEEVREQLNALDGEEKNKFREFMQTGGHSVKSAEWTDDDLSTIEEWLFGGVSNGELPS